MYFLSPDGMRYHLLEDVRTGEAPDPCGSRASKIDLLRHHAGKPNDLLRDKPQDIPLCKHCEKALAWMRDV